MTGDNYSLVKLFNYPCVHDDAPWREFYGGASFITCVRFRCDFGRSPPGSIPPDGQAMINHLAITKEQPVE